MCVGVGVESEGERINQSDAQIRVVAPEFEPESSMLECLELANSE